MAPHRSLALFAVASVAFGLVCCGGGCAGSREGGLDSPVPGARLDAIEAVARDYERTRQLPPVETRQHLVESLRADDPLVRFMAIGTLVEMTGDSRGYRHDDPEPLRRVAIDRWIPWVDTPSAARPMENAP